MGAFGDSDDEDDVADEHRYQKESILWCIEATESMLAPTLDSSAPPPLADPTPTSSARPPPTQATHGSSVGWKGKPAKSKMEECLRCAYAMMKRKVISSPKDYVGILIWNTAKEAKLTTDSLYPDCYVVQEVQPITAENIRKLKDLLEKAEDDPDFLPNLFGINRGQNVLGSALSSANSMFRARSPTAQNRIYLVTDNDDPFEGDERLHTVIKKKATDLTEMGYEIEPFFVPPSLGAGFDLYKFYGDILAGDEDDEGEPSNWPVVNEDLGMALESMVASMRTKEAMKRVAFKIPFVLGKDLSIGIVGYNMVGEEKRRLPTKVDLSTQGGDEVITKTVYKDEDTGEILDAKKEIKKYFQVGRTDYETGTKAAKIFFDDQEIRKVKTLGRPPSLKLLGFKPRKGHLKFWETIKHAHFIYPDEERYSGSTRAFASLLKSMVKKDVVGFASFIARTISKPQVVLLLPQAEKLNSAGVQVEPPGIHLCQLPFADDIRELGVEPGVSVIRKADPDASDDEEGPEQPEVDLAKKMMKYYSKPYNPDKFPNPALNYFYETLAAAALKEDLPEPEDQTIPLYEVIEQRVGKYIRQLRELVPQDEIDPTRVTTSKKTRVVKKEDGGASGSGEAPDLSDFVESVREHGAKLKVADLKAGLKAMGERTSGRKDELMERVMDYLRSHGLWSDEGDGEDDADGKARKGGKKKSKAKKEVDDDEDDLMLGPDDDDYEEKDAKPKTKKRRVVVPDDDEDDD
ncbi:hypothetical protein Rhopal_004446-T1 [Rhodotorula paludigena]|uniref:ATP-dependent DNA helicase II subunit 1 n=1 Tax=Rhodotorula paludigena TaxID=86838 RepID=A0AAV5GPH5_9BASI|nr:hypothetical protein Rhopal_004446-T1 [Rhodotorula paludigena]